MKFSKVMFLHLCVSHSVHEGGWLPSTHWEGVGFPTYQHTLGRGLCIQGGLHPGGGGWDQGEGDCIQGEGVCIQGKGLCIQGGGMGSTSRWGIWQTPQPPRYMGYYGIQSMSRWYTSYWNAFFLYILLLPATIVAGR